MDNNQNITKPISVAKTELMTALVEAVNNSGLPLCFVDYIVKDFSNSISNAAMQQAEKEINDYQGQLNNSKIVKDSERIDKNERMV